MPFVIFLLSLLVFTLTRLGLWLLAGAAAAPAALAPWVLMKGFWFDLLVACAFAGPACLYRAVCPARWRGRLDGFILWGAAVLLLFMAAVETAFWMEFSTRLNFIAVDYLLYTTEVIGKRESNSRPGAGILEFHHRAYNQDDKLVAECRRQVFMRMRPRG